MANARFYDRQASKGKNDMDVDAIEAEKPARQAAYVWQSAYEEAGPQRLRQGGVHARRVGRVGVVDVVHRDCCLGVSAVA